MSEPENPDPAVMDVIEARRRDPELSTSAQLRDAQTALAASQADLTRVEQERDEMVARKARMQRDLDAQLAEAREQLAEAKTQCRRLNRELDEALHDLAHAKFEIAMLRTQLDHARAQLPNPDENRG